MKQIISYSHQITAYLKLNKSLDTFLLNKSNSTENYNLFLKINC